MLSSLASSIARKTTPYTLNTLNLVVPTGIATIKGVNTATRNSSVGNTWINTNFNIQSKNSHLSFPSISTSPSPNPNPNTTQFSRSLLTGSSFLTPSISQSRIQEEQARSLSESTTIAGDYLQHLQDIGFSDDEIKNDEHLNELFSNLSKTSGSPDAYAKGIISRYGLLGEPIDLQNAESNLQLACRNKKFGAAQNALAELHLKFQIAPDERPEGVVSEKTIWFSYNGLNEFHDVTWINSATDILVNNVRNNKDARALKILKQILGEKIPGLKSPIGYVLKRLGDLYYSSEIPGRDQCTSNALYAIDCHREAAQKYHSAEAAISLYKIASGKTEESDYQVIQYAKQEYCRVIQHHVRNPSFPNGDRVLSACHDAGDQHAYFALIYSHANQGPAGLPTFLENLHEKAENISAKAREILNQIPESMDYYALGKLVELSEQTPLYPAQAEYKPQAPSILSQALQQSNDRVDSGLMQSTREEGFDILEKEGGVSGLKTKVAATLTSKLTVPGKTFENSADLLNVCLLAQEIIDLKPRLERTSQTT